MSRAGVARRSWARPRSKPDADRFDAALRRDGGQRTDGSVATIQRTDRQIAFLHNSADMQAMRRRIGLPPLADPTRCYDTNAFAWAADADANQEGWLAHFEGRSPDEAVAEYRRREDWRGLTGENDVTKNAPLVIGLGCTPTASWQLDRLAASASAEDGLVRREENAARERLLERVLEQLSPYERRLVRLRALGWSLEEIGRELGITGQAVGRSITKIQAKTRALRGNGFKRSLSECGRVGAPFF